jgi:hypothetical protein
MPPTEIVQPLIAKDVVIEAGSERAVLQLPGGPPGFESCRASPAEQWPGSNHARTMICLPPQ